MIRPKEVAIRNGREGIETSKVDAEVGPRAHRVAIRNGREGIETLLLARGFGLDLICSVAIRNGREGIETEFADVANLVLHSELSQSGMAVKALKLSRLLVFFRQNFVMSQSGMAVKALKLLEAPVVRLLGEPFDDHVAIRNGREGIETFFVELRHHAQPVRVVAIRNGREGIETLAEATLAGGTEVEEVSQSGMAVKALKQLCLLGLGHGSFALWSQSGMAVKALKLLPCC